MRFPQPQNELLKLLAGKMSRELTVFSFERTEDVKLPMERCALSRFLSAKAVR